MFVLFSCMLNQARPTYVSKCLVLLSQQPIFATMELFLRAVLSVGLSSTSVSLADPSSSSSASASSKSVSSGGGGATLTKISLAEQFPLEQLLVRLRYAMPTLPLDGRPVLCLFISFGGICNACFKFIFQLLVGSFLSRFHSRSCPRSRHCPCRAPKKALRLCLVCPCTSSSRFIFVFSFFILNCGCSEGPLRGIVGT